MDNWLDNNTQISPTFHFPANTEDIVENLPSMQHNVTSDISAQIYDDITANTSPEHKLGLMLSLKLWVITFQDKILC